MKKMLTLFTVLAFLLTSAGSAQSSMDFGFKVGGNMAKMSADDQSTAIFNFVEQTLTVFVGTVEVDSDARIGLIGGAFLSFNVSPTFSIQPELLYSVKGVEKKFRYNFNSTDFETVLQIETAYLEIPVLLKYKFPSEGNIKPSLYVGPALGFNLSGKFKLEEGTEGGFATDLGERDIANLKSTEFSGLGGFELGIVMGNTTLLLDIRYTRALTKAYEDSSPVPTASEFPIVNSDGTADDSKNSSFSLTVGVVFPLGGN